MPRVTLFSALKMGPVGTQIRYQRCAKRNVNEIVACPSLFRGAPKACAQTGFLDAPDRAGIACAVGRPPSGSYPPRSCFWPKVQRREAPARFLGIPRIQLAFRPPSWGVTSISIKYSQNWVSKTGALEIALRPL